MKAFLVLILTLASPAFAGDRIVPIGGWTGIGHQEGDSWDMDVQVTQGGARVDYPGFPCGGIWVFDTNFQSVRGTEWLTYGKDFCLDGLAVTLSLAEDSQLLIHWYDEIGAVVAHATLQSTQPLADTKKQGDGRKN